MSPLDEIRTDMTGVLLVRRLDGVLSGCGWMAWDDQLNFYFSHYTQDQLSVWRNTDLVDMTDDDCTLIWRAAPSKPLKSFQDFCDECGFKNGTPMPDLRNSAWHTALTVASYGSD